MIKIYGLSSHLSLLDGLALVQGADAKAAKENEATKAVITFQNGAFRKAEHEQAFISLMVSDHADQMREILPAATRLALEERLIVGANVDVMAKGMDAAQCLLLHKGGQINSNQQEDEEFEAPEGDDGLGMQRDYFESNGRRILRLITDYQPFVQRHQSNLQEASKWLTKWAKTAEEDSSQRGEGAIFACSSRLDLLSLLAVLQRSKIEAAKVLCFYGAGADIVDLTNANGQNQLGDNKRSGGEGGSLCGAKTIRVEELFAEGGMLRGGNKGCRPSGITSDMEIEFVDLWKSGLNASLEKERNRGSLSVVGCGNEVLSSKWAIALAAQQHQQNQRHQQHRQNKQQRSAHEECATISIACGNFDTGKIMLQRLLARSENDLGEERLNEPKRLDKPDGLGELEKLRNLGQLGQRAMVVDKINRSSVLAGLFLPSEPFDWLKSVWSFWKKFCADPIASANEECEKQIIKCKNSSSIGGVLDRVKAWRASVGPMANFAAFLELCSEFYIASDSHSFWSTVPNELLEGIASWKRAVQSQAAETKAVLEASGLLDLFDEQIIEIGSGFDILMRSQGEVYSFIQSLFKMANPEAFWGPAEDQKTGRKAGQQAQMTQTTHADAQANRTKGVTKVIDLNRLEPFGQQALIVNSFGEESFSYLFGDNQFNRIVFGPILSCEDLIKWHNCESLAAKCSNASSVTFLTIGTSEAGSGKGSPSQIEGSSFHKFLRYMAQIKVLKVIDPQRAMDDNGELSNDDQGNDQGSEEQSNKSKGNEDQTQAGNAKGTTKGGGVIEEGQEVFPAIDDPNQFPSKLYPTAIAMLITNPLGFYIRHILGIRNEDDVTNRIKNPVIKDDEEESNFGNALHHCCHQIVIHLNQGSMEQRPILPTELLPITKAATAKFGLNIEQDHRLSGAALPMAHFLAGLKDNGYALWPETEVESVLQTPDGGITIAARPDLIAIKNGQAAIFDYKTGQVGFSEELSGKRVQMSIAGLCITDNCNQSRLGAKDLRISEMTYLQLSRKDGDFKVERNGFAQSKGGKEYIKRVELANGPNGCGPQPNSVEDSFGGPSGDLLQDFSSDSAQGLEDQRQDPSQSEAIELFLADAKRELIRVLSLYLPSKSHLGEGAEKVGTEKVGTEKVGYIKTKAPWYIRGQDLIEILMLHDREII